MSLRISVFLTGNRSKALKSLTESEKMDFVAAIHQLPLVCEADFQSRKQLWLVLSWRFDYRLCRVGYLL